MKTLLKIIEPIADEFGLKFTYEDDTVVMDDFMVTRGLVTAKMMGTETLVPGYVVLKRSHQGDSCLREFSRTQSPGAAALQLFRYVLNDILRDRVEEEWARATSLDEELMHALQREAESEKHMA